MLENKNDKIITLIKQFCPDVKLVYLFGSQAQGQQTAASDWDIAVLCEHKITAPKRWDISEQLANELHAEVDFIDLLETSTVLAMQVLSSGKLLFDKAAFADGFEMQVYSMYGRLQEARSEIVNEFIKTVKEKGAEHARDEWCGTQ